MTSDYILKSACGLLFIGLVAGLIGQIELMKPGIMFLSEAAWVPILKLHIWATSISLCVICAFTLPLLRRKITVGYWIVWGAAAVLPLLIGSTANWHAFGVVGLSIALGGISAWQKMKGKSVPLKITIPIAILVSLSTIIFIIAQARLGVYGMPRRYVDYPEAFAQLQFVVSLSAIICVSLAGLYLVLLWRRPDERAAYLDDVF